MKSKTLLSSFLAVVAIAILMQYEIREYQRYLPSNYWPLKFVLQYGTATISTIASLIYARTSFETKKPLLSFIPITILFAGLTSVWCIRDETNIVKYEKILCVDGLYCDSGKEEILDGTYKTPSSWDGFGNNEYCLKEQFNNGVPAGKWMYSYKGDLIHSGIYLDEQKLTDQIKVLTTSARVDLNLWQEGNYSFLTTILIDPAIKDEEALNKIIKIISQTLRNKYKFKTLTIESSTASRRERLKEIGL